VGKTGDFAVEVQVKSESPAHYAGLLLFAGLLVDAVMRSTS
jgi:hypothetical protein